MHERVDEALAGVPVGLLARLERDELDALTELLGAIEQRRGFLRQLVLGTTRERVLELVVRQIPVALGEVALRDELEVGLAVVVAREPLVDDRPADRLAVDHGREGVAEPGRTRGEATERARLSAAVRMVERESIARRLRGRP